MSKNSRGYSTSPSGSNYILHLKKDEMKTLCGRDLHKVNYAGGKEYLESLCKICLRKIPKEDFPKYIHSSHWSDDFK